jgi:predicted PurR-regulated permease PerM
MPQADDPSPAPRQAHALPWLLAGVTLAFVWILLPFYGPILWAAVIALLFAPLQRSLLRRPLRRLRRRRGLAALLTLGLACLIVILPLALIAAGLAGESTALYQRLQSGELDPARYFRGVFDALPTGATRLLGRFGLVGFDALQARLMALLAQAAALITTQAFNLGQNTFDLAVGLVITVYLSYFMLRDGRRLVRTLRRALPLAEGDKRLLLARFGTVIRATVKGNLLVALVQGALGGLAFWVLDVGGALLWAVLMAFLSLLPAVGAALVWAPVALFLFVTGAPGPALALLAWGLLVIGLIDNLLRPLLVGQDTGMPDALVMISTLGGIAVFGLNGFILGPAIAAMFIAVWQLRLPAPPGPPVAPVDTPAPKPPPGAST